MSQTEYLHRTLSRDQARSGEQQNNYQTSLTGSHCSERHFKISANYHSNSEEDAILSSKKLRSKQNQYIAHCLRDLLKPYTLYKWYFWPLTELLGTAFHPALIFGEEIPAIPQYFFSFEHLFIQTAI